MTARRVEPLQRCSHCSRPFPQAKLWSYRSVYGPPLTSGREPWLRATRQRSGIRAVEKTSLRRATGRFFRERVRSSVTREELQVEPPLLCVPRTPLREVSQQEEVPRQTQDTLASLCVLAGLGAPRNIAPRAGASVGASAPAAAPANGSRVKDDQTNQQLPPNKLVALQTETERREEKERKYTMDHEL